MLLNPITHRNNQQMPRLQAVQGALSQLIGQWFTFVSVVVLLSISFSVHAQPIRIGADIPYSVLVDAKGELSFTQAESILRDQAAQSVENLSKGYVRDTFWLRFELPQAVFEKAEHWLQFTPNFLDDLQLFYREKNQQQPWQFRQTGDLFRGASDLNYRDMLFILPKPKSGSSGYEVVVRLQTSSSVILSAKLWQPDEFLDFASRSTSFWSFYFGLATLSALLALILAITLRTYLLWSATAFVVTYALVACVQGYVNWLLPHLQFPVQHYATSFGSIASYAVLLWMSSETLNLRQKLLWAHRILTRLALFIFTLIILVPFDHYGTAVKIKVFLLMPAYAVFIYAVIYLWIKDRFIPVTLGLAVLPIFFMIASLFSVFSILGLVPFYPELYVIWQYAAVLNILLIVTISVYRIRKRKQDELAQQQLAHELHAEREAAFNQRQFIGTVSHEFRTPLAVISAALENLRLFEDSDGSPRLARYEKIERASARLIQLTDNCLADARLSADITSLTLEPTDLMQLIASAASLVHVSDAHQLVLTVNGQPTLAADLNCQVMTDSAMMRIAISNVIDNAVKYSERGTISIDCRASGANVWVRICDEGPGIAGIEPETLFQRYRRGTSSKQGSGLGLYVARQITQASGGQLMFMSNGAKGCCFEFALKSVAED